MCRSLWCSVFVCWCLCVLFCLFFFWCQKHVYNDHIDVKQDCICFFLKLLYYRVMLTLGWMFDAIYPLDRFVYKLHVFNDLFCHNTYSLFSCQHIGYAMCWYMSIGVPKFMHLSNFVMMHIVCLSNKLYVIAESLLFP